MADHYETLSQVQLVSLLRKKDAEKRLGLVWERDEIEADAAIDRNFIACTIDPVLSDGAEPWRNLVIEGDNFDALRWLRMTYAHRVKCIYIDPPYNTGNKLDFVRFSSGPGPENAVVCDVVEGLVEG